MIFKETVFKKCDRFIRTTFVYPLILCLLSLQIESQALLASETEAIVSSKYPVDVSFMVVDLKYSEERGVKICEVQHGIISAFQYRGEEDPMSINFYHSLLQYHDRSWTTTSCFGGMEIQSILTNAPEWSVLKNLKAIEDDPDFQYRASLPVDDPYDIYSYHGFLAVKRSEVRDYKTFKKKYPGIIPLDAATHSYWMDKYKMTKLFSKDETLASYKPKWNLYAKKYTKSLANEIIDDLQSDIFVIKPRGADHGSGVIIVDRKNLDRTLKYILNRSSKLRDDSDASYNFWYRDKQRNKFDSFLVEEFVESDPLTVAHLGNKTYQPTMRVVFLLVYNNQTIEVKYLGGYWQLPHYSLSEGVILNDRHKSYLTPPYFCKVDPEVMEEVEQQLSVALHLLYQQMLMEK